MKTSLISFICMGITVATIKLISTDLQAAPSQTASSSSLSSITFDNAENAGRWARVNDSVMGGISTSTIYLEDGYGVFTGNLSLENNGGFASVRRLWSPNVPQYSKAAPPPTIKLRVVGDGQYYQLRFRTSRYMDGVSYASGFQTEMGKETVHEFSASDFTPVWRGRQVKDAKDLAWDDVVQVGIMITQKQKGPFTLKVASLKLD